MKFSRFVSSYARVHAPLIVWCAVGATLVVPLFVLWPDLRFVIASLQLARDTQVTVRRAQEYASVFLERGEESAARAASLRAQLTTISSALQHWSDTYPRARFTPALIDRYLQQRGYPSVQAIHTQYVPAARDVLESLTHLLEGNHRVLLLFQNNHELRATGGFLGSFLLIELNSGALEQFLVQDIYVPDGQYQGYTSAPSGVEEYLSAGRGLRLPDSNWNPDFPSAVNDMLPLFAAGGIGNIDGVVAINLTVAERLFAVLGPLTLPEYGQTVTAENLFSVARADRDAFFPGSQQKQAFLQALLTHVRLRFTSLTHPEQLAVASTLLTALRQKEVQIWSNTPHLQEILQKYRFDGALRTLGANRFYTLIESNVGINKANRLITRQVFISPALTTTTLTIQVTNANPPTTLKNEQGDYINYQRLLVPATHQVSALSIDGAPVDRWDDQRVETSLGEPLRQIGFLFPTPAQKTATATITLTHPELSLLPLTISKQSGLPPTPYIFDGLRTVQTLLLEEDTLLSP